MSSPLTDRSAQVAHANLCVPSHTPGLTAKVSWLSGTPSESSKNLTGSSSGGHRLPGADLAAVGLDFSFFTSTLTSSFLEIIGGGDLEYIRYLTGEPPDERAPDDRWLSGVRNTSNLIFSSSDDRDREDSVDRERGR